MSTLDDDRDTAVQLLNEAKLASETSGKVSALKAFWEVVVNKQPALIEGFVPEIALLQVDAHKAAKTFVAEFLERACLQLGQLDVLQTSLTACLGLVSDPTPAVVKCGIVASNAISRCVFWYMASQTAHTPEHLTGLWNQLSALKARICEVAKIHANDGVRLNAVKYMEQVVLMYTAASVTSPSPPHASVPLLPSHALLKPTLLAAEAQVVLGELISVLKAPDTETASSSSVIVALKAVTSIALQRTQHMGRILPTLLALSSCQSGGGAKSASMQAELRKSLLDILRCPAPASQGWTSKVESALKALGLLDSDIKKAGKRGRLGDKGGNSANGVKKRQKTGAKTVAVSAQNEEGGEPPDAQQVVATLTELAGLVQQADWDGLHALLQTLSAPVLVEVVLANMSHLPSRADVLAMEPLPARRPEPAEQEGPGEGGDVEDPMDVTMAVEEDEAQANAGDSTVHGYEFPDLKPDPDGEDLVGDAQHEVDDMSPAEGRLLSFDSALSLRKASFMRIVASAHAVSETFRGPVVARLATEAPLGDGVGDALLEHLMCGLSDHSGLELALKWLYSLFAAEEGLQSGQQAQSRKHEEGLEGVEGEEAGAAVQEACPAEVGSSDHSPTRYEAVLMALLEGMREQLPPSDKSITTIILDAPALPLPAILAFLQELCDEGGDWPTLALTTARGLIAKRPATGDAALGFILQQSTCQEASVRDKAVRLLANRLFAEPGLQASIEEFARVNLFRITEMGSRQPSTAADTGSPAVAVEGRGSPVQNGADANLAEQDMGEPARDQEEAVATSRQAMEDEALSWVELYTALCTKNHSLLAGLFQAFARSQNGYKGAVLRNADKLAMVLGPDADAVLNIVRHCPAGAEHLLLKMLYGLTEKTPPSSRLVSACLEAFETKKDPRLLPPALAGMPKQEAQSVMPSLLYLEPQGFKAALHRMLMPLPPSGEPQFTPSAILIALHSIDPGREGLSDGLKRLKSAFNVCLQQRDVFNADTLALALNQLEQRTPLPPLFMWFVLHTLVAAPRLRSFIVDLLSNLVGKQIWTNTQQWKGWLLCAQQGAPDSFRALLQLPREVLAESFSAIPDGTKFAKQLLDYATGPSCTFTVQRSTIAALQTAVSKA